MDYPELHLFIAGTWRARGGDGLTRDVINPATGEALRALPLASMSDLDEALAAASAGFKIWRDVSPYERAKVLRKAADLIRERLEPIALAMTMEEGKTLTEAKGEVAVAADLFDWCAEEGRRAYGRVIPARQRGQRFTVLREPVGPVAAFTPWNFPATTPARKIAGSLASGCSCILKPAEETPATALMLARALDDAGLPKGVLNIVFGDPDQVSRHLLASPVIRKLSFTGSTRIGTHLAKLAADNVIRTTMELGGHAPVIIMDDADLDQALDQALTFKLRNGGQVCTSPTRFYVHDRHYDAFVQRLADAMDKVELGDGRNASTRMGPLANPRRIEAMETLSEDALRHGAKLLSGGAPPSNKGYFYRPFILRDVPTTARIMNEEPFGPVVVAARIDGVDAAIAAANRLPFGLAAYVFSNNGRVTRRLGEEIEAGMIGINTFMITVPETPFGGQKHSGYGSEGGIEGLEAYQATKFIAEV